MDAPKTLGQRIVEAAWMAVGSHLELLRSENNPPATGQWSGTNFGQRSGTHGWSPAGRGVQTGSKLAHDAASSLFTDEVLPGGDDRKAPNRGNAGGGRSFFAEGAAE